MVGLAGASLPRAEGGDGSRSDQRKRGKKGSRKKWKELQKEGYEGCAQVPAGFVGLGVDVGVGCVTTETQHTSPSMSPSLIT